MGTYELSDEDAQFIVISLRDVDTGRADMIADKLAPQIPVPVPPGIGAVVRTEHPTLGGVYIRWATDNSTFSPWVRAGNHEQPYRTDEIGRIAEVLAPGVE